MKCKSCPNGNLILKDQVTYVYHYQIRDDGAIKWNDKEGYTPYLFFNREQQDFRQTVQCDQCTQIYDFKIKKDYDNEMVILKGAIHSQGEIDAQPFV
ncbi:hypothetical protein Amet_3180 [Alkaliphilus metalliredigens QYMF]|uniref:Uncharacterized protein n=1 Tax=Alkaliphilus metalliredigens (strain QYMF) TaxID=293826 RepID=A6TT00_ALKMQ|nr:hypothetical protein [Alkaliphilus metalliredigens]ABR49318.1 hypothetical protein Amet_3180 [Alkaliphilus metalliredigens QYMF]